jgi:hypothetical protein
MLDYLNNNVIIVIILIILIVYLYLQQNTVYDKLIGGFYESDESFCKESGLDMFCMYIEDNTISDERSGYILAYKDNEIILNEPVVIKLTRHISGNTQDVIYYDVDFIGLSDDVIDTFPNYQIIKFFPSIGKIIIYYDETVTAVLYKNSVNTELKYTMKDLKENDVDSEYEYEDDDDDYKNKNNDDDDNHSTDSD